MTLAVALPVTVGLPQDLLIWALVFGVVLSRIWRARP